MIGRAETRAPRPTQGVLLPSPQRASGRRECSENSLLVRTVTWLFTFKSITVKYNPDLGSSAVPRVICWWTPSGYFHHYRKFFQGAFCRGRCWGWGLGTEGHRNDLGAAALCAGPGLPQHSGCRLPPPGSASRSAQLAARCLWVPACTGKLRSALWPLQPSPTFLGLSSVRILAVCGGWGGPHLGLADGMGVCTHDP